MCLLNPFFSLTECMFKKILYVIPLRFVRKITENFINYNYRRECGTYPGELEKSKYAAEKEIASTPGNRKW